MGIDLLIPTHNRMEFTREVVGALLVNTDWGLVSRVVVMDDQSTDGTREFMLGVHWPVPCQVRCEVTGGPVAAMVRYLRRAPAEMFAKIDSDTIVPAGWLSECVRVMESNQELGLLGIEAIYPASGDAQDRVYEATSYIGGIGLMRSRSFQTLPQPNGRWGFTAWQQDQSPDVVKGWLNPALPVFLLDRLPMARWRSLSAQYVALGWQREWPAYDETAHGHLWRWWA